MDVLRAEKQIVVCSSRFVRGRTVDIGALTLIPTIRGRRRATSAERASNIRRPAIVGRSTWHSPRMRTTRRRPSPAMVVALIALFVALGGPAEAKKRLMDGGLLRKGTVTGREIKNGSLAKADLSKGAVRALTATPADSVGSRQIIDGQVLAPDLGAGSVGAAQLAAGAVTASKLAADSIGGGSVANGSLQTVDIGSFTGSLHPVPDFVLTGAEPCQDRQAPATPTGGQPNIADDVIVVSPPGDWNDNVVLSARPAAGNQIRVVACWIAPTGTQPTDTLPLGPTILRYVTFDAP
jgi:hypothetical protein